MRTSRWAIERLSKFANTTDRSLHWCSETENAATWFVTRRRRNFLVLHNCTYLLVWWGTLGLFLLEMAFSLTFNFPSQSLLSLTVIWTTAPCNQLSQNFINITCCCKWSLSEQAMKLLFCRQASRPSPLIVWHCHSRGRTKNFLVKPTKNKTANPSHHYLHHIDTSCPSSGISACALF